MRLRRRTRSGSIERYNGSSGAKSRQQLRSIAIALTPGRQERRASLFGAKRTIRMAL
jgi:hypothetical protein